jgi:hypothetical protein
VKTSGGDVYAGADGNVYKHTSDGWSKYNDGSWNPVQPPTNSKNQSQQNPSAQTRQSGSQQNSSGGTRQSASQQNLSGETRQTRGTQSNLSGETERGGAFHQGESGSGGFQQLENDRGARTMGAQREANFGAARQGGFGGGGGRFRR